MDEITVFIAAMVLGTGAAILAREVTRYAIGMWVRRNPHGEGRERVVVHLRNRERVSVEGRVAVTLRVRTANGRICSEPRMLAGPLRVTGRWVGEEGQQFVFECEGFQALTAWRVECVVEAGTRLGVAVEGSESGEGDAAPERFAVRQVKDGARRPQSPRWGVWWLTVAGAIGAYLFPFAFRDTWMVPFGSRLPAPEFGVDGLACLGIAGGSWVLFVACRRKVPPIIQGYTGWEALADTSAAKAGR
jgi:hypothetical protein